MSGDVKILKEYLLSLGYKVDEVQSRKFDAGILRFDKGVTGLATKVMAVGTAVAAMSALFARSMEKLYYSTIKAESSAANIQALEYAARQFGVSGETMRSSLEGMARQMRMNPGLQGLLESLGVPVQGRDKSKVLLDMLGVFKQMPFYIGSQYAQMFGIDPDTYLLLTQNIEALREQAALREQMSKNAGLDTEAAVKAGKEYAQQLREIEALLTVLKDTAMVALLPAMREVSGVVKQVLLDWTKIIREAQDPKSEGFFSKLWEAAKHAVGMSDLRGSRVNLVGDRGTPPPGSVLGDMKDKFLEYGGAKGRLPPIGIRQNNPGNLRSWGGAPTANGFANFATPGEGLSALAGNLLAYYQRHGLNTVDGIISRWAPPNENNTGAYIQSVSKRLGVNAKDVLNLKDPAMLSQLMDAIIQHENGYNPFSSADLGAAASQRLGGGVMIQQKTDIHVTSPDPASAGRNVAAEQNRVNATLVRNMQGAVQ